MSHGSDPVRTTLLSATLSHLMLGVAKELFPHRKFFDLGSAEKQAVAEHVRRLLFEVQTTFGEAELQTPRSGTILPPQRDEEYL